MKLQVTAKMMLEPRAKTPEQRNLVRALIYVAIFARARDAVLRAEDIDPRDLEADCGIPAARIPVLLLELHRQGAIELRTDGSVYMQRVDVAFKPLRDGAENSKRYRERKALAPPAAPVTLTPSTEAAGAAGAAPEHAPEPPAAAPENPVTAPEATPTPAPAPAPRPPKRPKIGWDAATGTFEKIDEARLDELRGRYPAAAPHLEAHIRACAAHHATAGSEMASPGGRLATWLGNVRPGEVPAAAQAPAPRRGGALAFGRGITSKGNLLHLREAKP